jgi:ABC-type transport system involved in multi-copper enzyme maturation permease subunit
LVVFSLIFSFYREKDTRLKEVYLSCFSHSTYLGGKLIGYLLLCLIYISLTSLIAGFILFLNNAFLWEFFVGSFGIFLKLSIFCSICLLFSSLFDYPLLASISTIFAYIASEFSLNALKIVSISKNDFARLFFRFLYHLLPNADKIDLKINAIYGESASLYLLVNIALYALIYILFSYFLSVLIFLRKEH